MDICITGYSAYTLRDKLSDLRVMISQMWLGNTANSLSESVRFRRCENFGRSQMNPTVDSVFPKLP